MQQAQSQGRPLPAWATDAPELAPGEEYYMRAFWALGTERTLAPGLVGPIPWSRIVEYGDRSGLEPDLVESLVMVVRALDEVYLGWTAEEMERNAQRSAQRVDVTVGEDD